MNRSLLVVAPVLALGLAACSGSSGPASAPPPSVPAQGTTAASSSPSATPSASPAPTRSAQAVSRACTAGGAVPQGARTRQIADVDHDGEPDTGFISGTASGREVIGVHTAAGGTFQTPFDSASGSDERTVVFAAVLPGGPFVALTDDGRQSQLYVVQGCALKAPVDAKGVPYEFDLGFSGTGDGVTCGRVAGSPETLVGFRYGRDSQGQKTATETRTAVLLSGYARTGAVHAVNGKSETVKGDPDPARISCGSVTEAKDGISSSTP